MATTTSLIAALDSHFMAVKARIAALNPQRQVIGPQSAQDWPPQQLAMEAFYCLELGAVPFGGTPTIVMLDHTVQWTWVIQGIDVQAGVQVKSRGTRYRTAGQMKAELLNGLFPYFTPKLVYSSDASGNLVAVPMEDQEATTWTQPEFKDRVDPQSGLLYGTATVHLLNMTDAVLS